MRINLNSISKPCVCVFQSFFFLFFVLFRLAWHDFVFGVAVFRMTTMELEASLYHASDNISSIMSNSGKGNNVESATNVGARRRKVRNTKVSDLLRSALLLVLFSRVHHHVSYFRWHRPAERNSPTGSVRVYWIVSSGRMCVCTLYTRHLQRCIRAQAAATQESN